MKPCNPHAAQVSYASNYQNAAAGVHPSEPNYIWAEGGSNFGMTNDNDPYTGGTNQTTTQSLGNYLQNKGVSWRSYQEDIDINTANNKVLPSSQYTVPLTSKSGTFTSGTQQLTKDLASNTVADYNWITPDQYNDAHSALTGGFTYNSVHYAGDQAAIAQGDHFLSQLVPQIMATSAYQNNGAIVIWWDETEGGDDPSRTIPEIILSPDAKGNAYTNSLVYTHSSDLWTMQEIFGVGPCIGDACNATDLSDLFTPGSIPNGIPATATPEPSTWAGVTMGLAVLAIIRRRLTKHA